MPNPLSNLGKVLGKLAEQVDVLPATGGAVEDLVHPEIEEREDRLVNRDERVFACARRSGTQTLLSREKDGPPSITVWP